MLSNYQYVFILASKQKTSNIPKRKAGTLKFRKRVFGDANETEIKRKKIKSYIIM